MLLAAEMATFGIFVAPLPFAARKKFFAFLSQSPIVAKVAYGLKISFMSVPQSPEHRLRSVNRLRRFIAILFVDALQRMFRVTAEVEMSKSGQGMQDVRTETNFAARKF
jgi:B-cell receptor-associated protein 31